MHNGEYRKWIYRNACTVCDSQAAIKALKQFPVNSKLVWDSCRFLVKLAEHNNRQLVGLLGHMEIDGNKMADQLARQGLIGPKPALGISAKVTRRVTRGWTSSMKHKQHWQSIRAG
jgi:ribonuclease HI